ncbi:MAG TPA: diacylglycerol kinase family protein [Bacteroidia bacterium]|jgi:YegS/Rv2252/BmrU family lipid kinase|nr:diacylglycerol kinase family protein [Bacteroidia bacterium]
MKKIAFIVNPKSGQHRSQDRARLIQSLVPEGLDYDILMWEKLEQKEELFKRALSGQYQIVAAAGGDGTVNTVAAALCGTDISLAIIPFGSGNGLARHLNIPMDTGKALQLLKTGRERKIDACEINQKLFFCTAGAGFDAHIGKLFAESRNRGMRTYAQMIIRQIAAYKPLRYKLHIDGVVSEHEAFLITFANAAQYGGNAYIAPLANIEDGLIDISIIYPFPLLKGLLIAYRMFNKSLHHSHDVQLLRGKHIILERAEPGPVHYDGEPDTMGTRLEIKILPSRLKVIVP